MSDDEQLAHEQLLRALYGWATQHMDQWEMIQFDTPRGVVYVKITQLVGDGWNYENVTDLVRAAIEPKL